MTLSEMRQFLSARGIRLSKSLGQNFLHDAHQLQRIADAADLKASDKVLEIGPGLGPLTELLIRRANHVLAIEKDQRLVEVLEERFNAGQASSLSAKAPVGGNDQTAPTVRVSDTPSGSQTGKMPGLQLLHADALEWLKNDKRDWSDWKLVSNLPYSVASPILVELCQGSRSPRLMVVTLQTEVVQRLLAKPGGKDYGVLTLLAHLDLEPMRWFKIPASCFFPRPEVDSACIILKRRAEPLIPDALRSAFAKLVKRAFSQRRKMMKKLLQADWPSNKLEAAMMSLSLDTRTRAEAVSLEQFAALTKRLAR